MSLWIGPCLKPTPAHTPFYHGSPQLRLWLDFLSVVTERVETNRKIHQMEAVTIPGGQITRERSVSNAHVLHRLQFHKERARKSCRVSNLSKQVGYESVA